MVPFNLEFDFGDVPVAGTAEQLDQLADTAGFMRYQVAAGERQSVICVNIEEETQQLVTPQDAEAYYEAVYYPEYDSGFSEDEVFSAEEVAVIVTAIKAYNNSRRLTFDQMNFDF